MDRRTSMLELEARLGFKFTSGISRTKGARDIEVISKLLDGIDEINTRYVAYGLKKIRNSQGIKIRAEKLFHDLGPVLWKSRAEAHSPWLFLRTWDKDNPLIEAYPKDLCYSDPNDREILWKHFFNLIKAKLRSYHDNHRNDLPQGCGPPDSDCLPNSEASQFSEDNADQDEDEANSNRGHAPADDDEDEDSSYSAPRSKRRQNSCKRTPRSRGRKNMQPFVAPPARMTPRDTSMGNVVQGMLDENAAEIARKRALQKPKTSGLHQTPRRDGDVPPVTGSYSQPAPAGSTPGFSRFTASTPTNRNRPGKRHVNLDGHDASKKRMRTSQEAPATTDRGATSSEAQRAASTPISRLTTPSVSGVESNPIDLAFAEQFASNHKDETTKNLNVRPHEHDHVSSSASGQHRPEEQGDNEARQDTIHVRTGEDSPKSRRLDKGYQDYLQQLEHVEALKQAAVEQPSMNPNLTQNDGQGSSPSASELPLRQQSSPEASRTNEACSAEKVGHQLPESGNVGHAGQAEPQKASEGLNASEAVHQNAHVSSGAHQRESGTVTTTAAPAASASARGLEEDSLTDIWFSIYFSDDDSGALIGVFPLTGTYTHDSLFQTVEASLREKYPNERRCITAVNVKRADGKRIHGCPHDTMPIRKAGRVGTWEQLLKKLLKSGEAGDGLFAYLEMSSAAERGQ